jgi:hypothetical protein
MCHGAGTALGDDEATGIDSKLAAFGGKERT